MKSVVIKDTFLSYLYIMREIENYYFLNEYIKNSTKTSKLQDWSISDAVSA